MNRVELYKRNKRIKEMGFPKMYVVHSCRNGVDKPVEYQVTDIEINENSSKYKIDHYPYEVIIEYKESSVIDEGYGTGIGDLWDWTYFCSLSKEDADKWYDCELKRVIDKYLSNNKDNDIILPCCG